MLHGSSKQILMSRYYLLTSIYLNMPMIGCCFSALLSE
jgi:hypothetical protein